MVDQKVSIVFDDKKANEYADEIEPNHDLKLGDCLKVDVVAFPDCQAQKLFVVFNRLKKWQRVEKTIKHWERQELK